MQYMVQLLSNNSANPLFLYEFLVRFLIRFYFKHKNIRHVNRSCRTGHCPALVYVDDLPEHS